MLTLYLNGLPYLEYEGDNTLDAIKSFIIQVSEKLNTVTSFTNTTKNTDKETLQENKVTLGKPYTKKKNKV